MVGVREEGEQRHRSGDDDYAEQGNVGCDLFHPGKRLIDEIGASPAGQTWGQKCDDCRISEREVKQGVCEVLVHVDEDKVHERT